MKTSHWGQIASAGILIANPILSSVCGHSVDVSQIDWVGVGSAQLISWADWITRHFGKVKTA